MLVYMLVTLYTPGPNNLTSMCLSAQYGFRGTRRFRLGNGAAFLFKALLCGALNLALSALLPGLVPYLKWFGAAYMLYLAWGTLRNGWRGEASDEPTGRDATFAAGVALQMVNVKSWVYCLSIFSTYVVPYTQRVGAIALVAVISNLLAYSSIVLWALCGSALRRVYQAHRKAFSAVMAGLLAFCAVTAVK